MPTTPVLVQTWLDPPLQTDFQVGDSVTWHASFIDRISRQLVTPDLITFSWSNPPVSSTPTVATVASLAVTLDATGLCHYDLPLNSPGRWVLNVSAQGNPGTVGIGNSTLYLQVFGSGL